MCTLAFEGRVRMVASSPGARESLLRFVNKQAPGRIGMHRSFFKAKDASGAIRIRFHTDVTVSTNSPHAQEIAAPGRAAAPRGSQCSQAPRGTAVGVAKADRAGPHSAFSLSQGSLCCALYMLPLLRPQCCLPSSWFAAGALSRTGCCAPYHTSQTVRLPPALSPARLHIHSAAALSAALSHPSAISHHA